MAGNIKDMSARFSQGQKDVQRQLKRMAKGKGFWGRSKTLDPPPAQEPPRTGLLAMFECGCANEEEAGDSPFGGVKFVEVSRGPGPHDNEVPEPRGSPPTRTPHTHTHAHAHAHTLSLSHTHTRT